MNYIICDGEPDASIGYFPNKHYASVYSIVTVQNNFKSVEQLLNAVAVQTNYNLQYTINANISVLKDYEIEYDWNVINPIFEKDNQNQ